VSTVCASGWGIRRAFRWGLAKQQVESRKGFYLFFVFFFQDEKSRRAFSSAITIKNGDKKEEEEKKDAGKRERKVGVV